MRTAVIDNGIVVNVIEAGEGFELPGFTLIASEDAQKGWTWDGDEFTPQTEPGEPVILTPYLFAVARLIVQEGWIDGIDVASKFSAAMQFDVGLYYVFFVESQPDDTFLVKAYGDANRYSIIERTVDYIAIAVADEAGTPVDPAEINIEIIRVR